MQRGWDIFKAKDAFDHMAEEWQHLCHQVVGPHPLFDVDFISPLVDHFGTDHLKLARYSENNVAKALLLLDRKKKGVWESFAPGPAPLGAAVLNFSSVSEQNKQLKSLTQSLPGFVALLGLNRIDPDFATIKIPDLDSEMGPLDALEYIQTMRLRVTGDFQEYWSSRSANLKKNIKRKVNKIAQNNVRLRMRKIIHPEDIEQGVRTYGNIETKGWKGELGSSVHIDNVRGRFYSDMLRRFAGRNCAYIFELFFDDKVVASRLSIQQHGMLVALKTTYDEEMSLYAPGNIMRFEFYKYLFSEPTVEVVENYGNVNKYIKQWSDDVRKIYHYNYYPNAFFKKLHCTTRSVYSKVRKRY